MTYIAERINLAVDMIDGACMDTTLRECFEGATDGDVSPEEAIRFRAALRRFVTHWAQENFGACRLCGGVGRDEAHILIDCTRCAGTGDDPDWRER